jgi:hypothetical protein
MGVDSWCWVRVSVGRGFHQSAVCVAAAVRSVQEFLSPGGLRLLVCIRCTQLLFALCRLHLHATLLSLGVDCSWQSPGHQACYG